MNPQPKPERVSAKVRRALKKAKVDRHERDHKRLVRVRDVYCRFPSCGCRKFHLPLHVSHVEHKGMGGDVTGERSTPDKMMLLCSARHRENRISVDKGTMRWVPLTSHGAAGACAFEVDLTAVRGEHGRPAEWFEVGRETSQRILAPLSSDQTRVLRQLAEMTL